MVSRTTGRNPAPQRPMLEARWLLVCIFIFLVLRLRWVGHLLSWDEAMNLCTVRSLAAQAGDVFSNWFWRHPPLYSLLTLLLSPLQRGFAERVQLLNLCIGVINLLLLYALVRRVSGTRAALWTAFVISVAPGCVFFDVWVKRDHVVVSFALAAFLFLFAHRSLYAGLCLGLSLLAKETAVFYLAAAVLMWGMGAAGRRRWEDVAALVGVPMLVSGWWFFLAGGGAGPGTSSPGILERGPSWRGLLSGAAEHLRFAAGSDADWTRPFTYYLTQLPSLLGLAGVLLAGVGVVSVVLRAAPRATRLGRPPGAQAFHNAYATRVLWPVVLLLPAYVLLSALPAKVAWIVIVLLPAWAALQGEALSAVFEHVTSRSARPVLAAAYGTWAIAAVLMVDYESRFRRLAEGQWRGAEHSRQAALLVNSVVQDGDRLLLTSFHYWKNLGAGHPCAVFTYYLERDIDVLVRPHAHSFEDCLDDVMRHELDWALLSPEPNRAAGLMIEGFATRLGAPMYPLPRAVLFDTRFLNTDPPQAP